MAESSSQQPTPQPTPDPIQYWCYQCDKRVSVDTLPDLPDLICHDCNNGFVESIAARDDDEPSFGNELIEILRLISQSTRDDHAPPPPPTEHPDPSNADDNLRIELDGWDNNDDDNDSNDVEAENEEEENRRERNEDDLRINRRNVIRYRLRDFATGAATRRIRINHWADIEFRFQIPELDGYVANPGDYVDEAGYEALLQNLAENDGGGRRGAPPAAKSAVSALQTFEIKSKEDILVCAICRDSVNVGEMAKKLPCGHEYHGDCVLPWLASRNSCPVCRFELPTDDPEYEEERKKRTMVIGGDGSSSSDGYVPGLD